MTTDEIIEIIYDEATQMVNMIPAMTQRNREYMRSMIVERMMVCATLRLNNGQTEKLNTLVKHEQNERKKM